MGAFGESFTTPENNIAQIGIEEGMKVVDLGAGSGHYALALAPLLGEKGKVYAVEVQRELAERLKKEAVRRGFLNVEVLWGDIEEVGGTKLVDRVADVAILSNVLFQLEDKETALKEARRLLKPGGKLLLVDWCESFGGMGPQPEQVLSPEKARALAEGVGFRYDASIVAGPHHYGFLVSRV